MNRSAILSDDLVYRYQLTRIWDTTKGSACFVMLNPSVADANIDDPTIRRCVGFATKWGCGGIIVVNLSPFRATDPKELRGREDIAAEAANRVYISDAMRDSIRVIAAWGAFDEKNQMLYRATQFVKGLGLKVWCFGKTKYGQPRHPLYVRGDKELEEWGHE